MPPRRDRPGSRAEEEVRSPPRPAHVSSKALEFAYDCYVGKDKAKAETFEAELANADVARKIYDLRTKAGLTQGQLAKLVGTSTSVISRLVGSKMLTTKVIPSRCSGGLPRP